MKPDSRRQQGIKRHGKQTLAWGVFFFLLGQAALAYALTWPELRDPEYGRKLVALRKQFAAEPRDQPLFIVLGSSRSALGIRPTILKDASLDGGPAPRISNFSLLGSGPLMELLCFRRLLADGIRPDCVLVEVWPPFLDQEEASHAEERRLAVERLGRHDLPLLERYSVRFPALLHEWHLVQACPAYSQRFNLLSQFAPGLLPWNVRQDASWRGLDESGWLCNSIASEDPVRRTAKLAEAEQIFSRELKSLRISARADRALRELIELAQDEGIAVVLFHMPESSEFRGWYAPDVEAQTQTYLKGLSASYGVPWIDARGWSRDAHFWDGYHLHPAGAAVFTQRLGREVLQPLMASVLEPSLVPDALPDAEERFLRPRKRSIRDLSASLEKK